MISAKQQADLRPHILSSSPDLPLIMTETDLQGQDGFAPNPSKDRVRSRVSSDTMPIISMQLRPGTQVRIPASLHFHEYHLIVHKLIGTGTFAKVYHLHTRTGDAENGPQYALKRAGVNRRFANRELEMMLTACTKEHPSLIQLCGVFRSQPERDGQDYCWNLLMDHWAYTAGHLMHHQSMTSVSRVRLLMWQVLRGLAFLHALGMGHRDVKPANILIDRTCTRACLCDFGSAKIMRPGQKNGPYITTRYYRAPELLLGEQYSTTQIDMWSIGVVFAQFLIGKPLFTGSSPNAILSSIIGYLGPPPLTMPNSETVHSLIGIEYQPLPLELIKAGPSAMDLFNKLVCWEPQERFTALEAMKHPFFDVIRASRDKVAIPELQRALYNALPYETVGPAMELIERND